MPIPVGTPPINPVLTGNRVLVYFAGQPIGFCTSVEATDDYGLEPAMNIGTIYVPEYVPTVADFTLQVSSMILSGGDLFGGAGSTAAGTSGGVLAGYTFDFAVSIGSLDNGGSPPTQGNLVKYTGCTFSRGTVRIDAHRIVVYQATFKATGRGVDSPNANVTPFTSGGEEKSGASASTSFQSTKGVG